MDVMNMTIAQLVEKAQERREQLVNEIALYERIEADAAQTRDLAEEVHYLKPNETTRDLLEKAEDNYWQKSNHLYELNHEHSQLSSIMWRLQKLAKCEQIYQVADILGL